MAYMDELSGGKPDGTERGKEVAVQQSAELVRTAGVGKNIQRFRSVNELNLRQTLWTGMPIGLAAGLIQSGSLLVGLLAIPLLAIAVIHGVDLFRNRPKAIQAGSPEIKSGDYSSIQVLAPFLPALGWLVAIPLDFLGFGGLELPPLIRGVIGSVFFGFGISFGTWGAFSQAFRIGKRRIKKIIEKESLVGVTQARMEAIEENSDVIGALVAAGAVDGNELSVANLGKLLEWDKEDIPELQARVNEIQSTGVIKITGQSLYKQAKHWNVTVTPDGIRNIAQLGRR